MRDTLEVLIDGARTPTINMALDEEGLAPGARGAQLRIYTWAPTGLSLGYFQRYADFADLPGVHEIVRRTTGGGAIYHEAELTFALTCDEQLMPPLLDDRYEQIHAAATRALHSIGVPAQRCGKGAAAPRPDETWCYAKPTCHDLIVPATHPDETAQANATQRSPNAADPKLVGSAQRRANHRVLHHGSIPLRHPSLGPRCGAVEDYVTDLVAAEQDLTRMLIAELATTLQLEAVESADTPGTRMPSDSAVQNVLARTQKR